MTATLAGPDGKPAADGARVQSYDALVRHCGKVEVVVDNVQRACARSRARKAFKRPGH